MRRIEESFVEFTKALEQGKAVNCTRSGKWYCEGLFMRFIRWLFRLDDRRVANVARVFNQCLDKLEKIPVKFNVGYNEPIEDQKEKFGFFLSTAKVISQKLKKYRSKRVKIQASLLNHREIALKFRPQKEVVTEPVTESQTATYNELINLGKKWKDKNSHYIIKDIDDKELLLLKRVCDYPELPELLKKDSFVRDNFFKWTFRDKNDPAIFVQYPDEIKKIHRCYLSGRLGRFAEPLLMTGFKTAKDETQKKELQMVFEGKAINVLNENKKITFKNNYVWKVKEIYKEFSLKNIKHCDLEAMEDGINNWSSFQMGPWNPAKKDYDRVDFKDPLWYTKVHRFQTFSKEEVESQCHLKTPLAPGQWVAVAVGMRQRPGMDLDKSHGYMEIFVPADDGKYQLLPIGSYPIKFPINGCERARFPGNTVKARKCFPDDNPFMTIRQKAGKPFVLSQEEGEELMKIVTEDFEKGFSGDDVFQWAWKNCSAWVQMTFEKLLGREKDGGLVPNLFITPILDTRPKDMLGGFFRFFRKLPKGWQHGAVKVFSVCMGSHRGQYIKENNKRVFKSLKNAPFSDKRSEYYHNIFVPSKLHEQILKKEIDGFVTMGHA